MNAFRKAFSKKLMRSGEFGTVTVKQPPAQPLGTVTVKEPPKQSLGTVTVKPPAAPKGFGKVIRKSRKFGIDPKAIKSANAKLAASIASKPAAPQAPPVTHVAGVEIPHEVKDHFHSGNVVPYDHPHREAAARFVTDVWRRNEGEGRRMSEKLLGIGEGGKQTSANVKPGYATIKGEPGSATPPPSNSSSGSSDLRFPSKEQGQSIQQSISGDLPNKTGLANVAQQFGALFGKAEDEKPPESPKYNPRTERPNQRARVADVKAKLTAAPMLGDAGHKVSLSTTNSKLAKDGVASFNLVPIETCPGAGSCAKYCYADTGSYLRFHKTTMPPRVSNWLASQKEDFVPKMVEMIGKEKAKGKIKAIRVHDSGDFYSPQYIDKWHKIASAHPDMTFYAYTKSHHPKLRERLNELEKLPNFNIVQSFGSKWDHLIDPSKPHAVVFPSKELMDKAGYADAMETDLTASKKNNTKVGLYIHGQYDKSYPGLAEHIKDNPQVRKEIEDSIKANGGQIEELAPDKKVS